MVARFRPVRAAAAGVFGLVVVRSLLDIAYPRLVAEVFADLSDQVGRAEVSTGIWGLLGALGLVILGRQVLFYVSHVAATRVGQVLENDLRSELFDRVMHLRFRYHDRNRSGETIARSLRDMEQTKHFYREVWFGYLQLALLLVAVLVAIGVTHPLYLACVVPVYTLAMACSFRLGRRVGTMDREFCDDYDEVLQVVTENVAGARVVRAFGREQDEVGRFGTRLDKSTGSWRALEQKWSGNMPFINHLYALAMAAVFALGAYRVVRLGAPLAEVLFVVFCTRLIHQRVRPLMRLVIVGQKAVASAARVFEVLDNNDELRPATGSTGHAKQGAALRFEDVHFAHAGGRDVLAGITLDVPAGSSLGLIGPTGSGKTSLVQLLPRFYDPTSGRVLLDGVDVRDRELRTLREEIALVFQEPFLFSDTVAGNVAYGNPGAPQAAVEAACVTAQAAPFIAELQAGFETIVGERGVSLSGGQRQRLTIARALAASPRVLVLDDATASLDAVTEQALLQALRDQGGACTRIVISQRVPSVRWCDRIAVLDQGKVVGLGTHDDLLRTCPLYLEIDKYQRLHGVVV